MVDIWLKSGYLKVKTKKENMNTDNQLFNTVYKKDLLNLKNKKSQIDFKSLVDLLEFEKSDVSKIANVAKSSVRYDQKIPKEVKDHLEQIYNICQLVAEHFDGDRHKTALWFKTMNPLLGGVTPRDMIRFGRYKKLMNFIISNRTKASKSDQEAEAA